MGIVALLGMAAAFVAGVFTCLISANLLVPLVVHAAGRERYADPDGLDGCAVGLGGGAATALLIVPVWHLLGWGMGLLTVPAVGVLALGWGLVTLQFAGFGRGRREFLLTEDGDVRAARDGLSLAPACVLWDSEYHQTDAYRGYTYYSLELYDVAGRPLARNGYRGEDAMRADLRRLTDAARAGAAPCLGLDVLFVWRRGPLDWLRWTPQQGWLPLLCRETPGAGEEPLEGWRPYLLPALGTASGRRRLTDSDLSSLAGALETTAAREGVTDRALWNDVALLRALARRAGDDGLLAVTTAEYEAMAREAAPDGGTLMHSSEGGLVAVTVEPR